MNISDRILQTSTMMMLTCWQLMTLDWTSGDTLVLRAHNPKNQLNLPYSGNIHMGNPHVQHKDETVIMPLHLFYEEAASFSSFCGMLSFVALVLVLIPLQLICTLVIWITSFVKFWFKVFKLFSFKFINYLKITIFCLSLHYWSHI